MAVDDFEQQSQDDIASRMRKAMMAAKFGLVRDTAPTLSDTNAPAPSAMSPMETATATASPQLQQPPQSMATTTPTPVALAHAVRSEAPATVDVNAAQSALDRFDHPSKFKQIAVPALAMAGSLLNSRSWNARAAQDTETSALQKMADQNQTRRQSLVGQLQHSQTMQEQEYEADQRNRQQDVINAANNSTRSLLGKLAADSRQNVAQTAADSRETVANTRADASRDVAQTGADARVKASRYAADQAMTRLMYGQDRQDQRQQRGISAGFQRQEQGYENTLQKPTADEDRRADLANAAVGYANVLKDIMSRRPELFGKIAGRVTNVRNMVGTSDPDVAELKYIKEQLGIVQMGAHSLRSAQAIAPIADSLVNSFNNDAPASIKVLDDAQEGLKMFTGPQTRPTVATPGRPSLTHQVSPSAAKAAPASAKGAPAAPVNEMMWDPKLKKAVPIAH